MIKVKFTDEDKKALNYERYNHPHPRVQLKMEALWLKSLGYSTEQISEIADISKSTFYNYLKEYVNGGIDKLKEVNFYKPQSELVTYTSSIENEFRQHPPATTKEAMARIEEMTGLKRCESQIRKFLKNLGMKRLKIGHIPSKADPDKQDSFKKEKMQPIFDEAKNGKRKVLFVDAAHFVLAPFLGYLWCFCRLFIKAPAGRKRFNVLGALDAITHELITVTNDTYINSLSICELVEKLRYQYPLIPITLILDNAKYQKCHLVFAHAAEFNIDLLYLPSYSPNLNLIERLWKFVKKKVLYSKYYADFDSFKKAISDCLAHTHDIHKTELDSLLTLKFQSFNKSKKLQVMNL